ncbi:MAG: YfhO family protein [Clostridia bacterium]|nr:YfhO family protein [Clostridia bacterium]
MTFSTLKRQTLGVTKEKGTSTFLIALLTAAAFFVPFMIQNGGYFLFYGDFNVQQIPFYKHCHEMLRSGNIGWDFGTDLGVNFVGSYSFYTLGSPFFWLTLPFPTDFVPYLIGPLLILKFAFSALTGYLYIRRFTRTPEAARLGGLLYAFSGFSVYNIFFNHFHEAIVFFPLLLLSLELLITENRRGFFAAMVAITAITNYFFFFGMVVFTVIYWFVRVFSGCYKMRVSRFLWFVFEAVLGLLISAAILLPTCHAVLGNSRVSEFLYGWSGIMYGKEQIYLNIFECFFFPPDIPARPVFFPGADVKWSSLGGWLPLFSMVGVFAWLQQKKGTWQRRMIGISIFMALVPVLNSAFYMFNSAYYARWYYMPILIMSLVTAMGIEDTEIHFKSPFKWVMGITVAATAVIGLFPQETEDGRIEGGLYEKSEDFYLYRFLATAAIAIISLVILGLLLKSIKKQRKQFMKSATAIVCVISIIYAGFFVICGRSHSYDYDVVINDLIEAEIDLGGDKDSYRIDVFDGIDNTGMFLDYSTINAFHSIVPTSVTDFWEFVGEERGVASRPEPKSYAARSLLGVKYLLAKEDGESFTDDMGRPKVEGFEFYRHEKGYDVYINKNYVGMGFTYDYYMTEAQAGGIEDVNRSNAMMKAILLTDEQVAKYGGFLINISDYGKQRPEDGFIGNDVNSVPSTNDNSSLPYDSSEESQKSELITEEVYQNPANASATAAEEETSALEVLIPEQDESMDSAQSDASDFLNQSYESDLMDFGDTPVDNTTEQPVEDGDFEYQEEYDAEFYLSTDALLDFYYDEQELEEDAAALKENAVDSFNKTENGFSASITTMGENLVFFSVPYDEGWTATVNGKKAEIERVNKGFMAVAVSAGANEIEFSYETPGLKLGVMITAVAFLIWLLYTLISAVLSKKGRLGATEYPEGDTLIEKFKRDTAKDLMMENAEDRGSLFDVEITDDSIIYGYDEQTSNFNRGFWINTDTEEEEMDDVSLSDLLNSDEENSKDNEEQ